MANNSPTLVMASLSDDQLKKSIDSLVTHVDEAMKKMVQSTNNAVGEMEAKLKSLGNLKIDSGGSADGGSSKRTKAQNAETNAVKESAQAYKEKTLTLDQQASAINTAIQSEKKYTDEIRNQAAAIRATKEWQEKGRYRIGDASFYDPETSRLAKKDIISLEEQILQWKKKQTEETEKATRAEYKYSDAIKNAADELRAHLHGARSSSINVGGQAIFRDLEDVTIERQLNSLVAERGKEFNLQKAVTEAIAADEKRISEELQKEVDNERKINSERQNRINTKSADFWSNAERENIVSILAQRNQIDRSRVKNWDEETSSIQTLSSALKQYQTAYQRLTAEQRNSPVGKQLIVDMQVIERSVQKARAELSRPIDLESVMRLPQKTLDDIAYKMRQLASYRSGLNVETQTKEITQVNDEYNKLKKRMDEVMQKNQQMIASNTALGRSWNYMKNRLAFYFTVGASTQFVKQLIDIRGQYELLDRSIGILIDSAQNGSQIFAELNAMAIKSPFTTMELGAAAKQLVAYDVAAKDVVDTTRRLADMAAAVGIPIERLTYALGQIKAYGYLNARDARMFANAGIPLVKELADYYTELEGRLVSTADVYDRIKKKAIDYNDVMSVVNKMTDEGGKFFDFQEKAADTLKVRIANLTLAWNNMLNEMGKDNQGVLTEGLKVTKQIFESWRDINNMVIALGLTYGTIKAAQIAYYLWVMRTEKAVGAWSKIINAIDYAFNAKIANVINSLKTSLVGFFTNPAAMLTVAFTALSVALTKAYLDYRDLQAANEEFNKSVVKNAEENVKSIDKFFGDYKKQLESVGSLNSADQTKLWERVQEEIEKTTKNAEKYIEILNKIPEVSKRIEVGESVLEQSKRIQDELRYMAERGMFNVGGGFANDSAAKDLQQYSDAVNELITKYGDLDNAKKEALKVNEITLESGETIRQYTGEYADFQRAQIEAEKELQNIVSTLDKVNMAEILGTGDMETQLANVRSFAIAWRDAFLATEKGSKISAEGQALLNSYIDKWIEQQARVNHLIKDENTAAIEANRTAWETFFKFLNTEERKRLDVAIKTNQLGSKSVQELWDNAAERMQEKATTSYNLIQQQIADLRNTPDIVINVVYRNNKEKLEKDQEEFEKKYIQPKNWGALSTDEYLKQEKANREKYGTLMRKQGEDAVEYEKRISDERKTNLALQKKNGDIIEENKNKTDAFSQAVTEQAKKEKQAADDRLKIIKEVEDAGGYDFSTKSENAAARKAQKQAESELAKALKDELSTIEKVRSIYKDLTKEGMSHANAVERATRGWNETVNAINRVLQKNGLQKLDLSKFAGIENPRELVNMLQSQLNTLLKRGAKPAEIKELQTKIQTLNVDAEKYDLTKITKGLNNELDKLKDEYELAVELDANPELGGIFADMIGLSKEQLEQMPKDFDGVVSRLQQTIDSKLGRGKFNLMENLNKSMFDSWLKTNQHGSPEDDAISKSLKAVVDYANKVRVDETKKQTEEWNKLLEKYAEYEYKKQQIRKQYESELETARKKGADKNIVAAITNRYNQENAKLDFEQFKTMPQWITATGDLAGLTHKALGMLIDDLVEYKKNAKNLNPKQIKEINRALKSLYKEQRKNNPFLSLANAMDEAADRASVFQEEIDNSNKELLELENNRSQKNIADVAGKIDKLRNKIKKLNEEKDKAEKVDVSVYTEWFNSIISLASNAADSISDMMNALAGKNGSGDAKAIKDMFDILGNAGQWAAVGGQIGGAYGAVIGGAFGAITSVVTKFADEWSGNADITWKVEQSERAVKRLELAYVDLKHAMDEAYGTAEIGAQRAIITNKELQLAELKRQLQLEQSRKAKNKDYDRILELRKQIRELEYDIVDSINGITNSLLGISSIGNAAETLVTNMIAAFKKGEQFMDEYKQSFDDMIDNMIMKAIVSNVIGKRMQELFDRIQKTAEDRASSEKEAYEKAAKDYEQWLKLAEGWIEEYYYFDPKTFAVDRTKQITKEEQDELWKQRLEYLKKQYEAAMTPTPEDVQGIRDDMANWRESVKEEFLAYMDAFGVKYGQDSAANLSSLQQGISGVTETTAQAVEAYLNGMSQQAYLRNDLLTQIRDAVVGMDIDVQTATMGEILLQLRSSYEVQMAIHGILEGVLTPSGRAFSVELIS